MAFLAEPNAGDGGGQYRRQRFCYAHSHSGPFVSVSPVRYFCAYLLSMLGSGIGSVAFWGTRLGLPLRVSETSLVILGRGLETLKETTAQSVLTAAR